LTCRLPVAAGRGLKYHGFTMVSSKRRSPVPIRDVLVAAVPELRDRVAEKTLRDDWIRLVGAELGRRSHPERLKGDVLEVIVDNSPCLQELKLRAQAVLSTVRTRFPAVATLKFTLGTLPSRGGVEARPARPQSRPTLSPEDLHVVEAMATTLPDPILAGGLRRLLTKDLLARRRREADRRRGKSLPAERENP
jgi:hypothetical protein